jgi:hypothetical protein
MYSDIISTIDGYISIDITKRYHYNERAEIINKLLMASDDFAETFAGLREELKCLMICNEDDFYDGVNYSALYLAICVFMNNADYMETRGTDQELFVRNMVFAISLYNLVETRIREISDVDIADQELKELNSPIIESRNKRFLVDLRNRNDPYQVEINWIKQISEYMGMARVFERAKCNSISLRRYQIVMQLLSEVLEWFDWHWENDSSMEMDMIQFIALVDLLDDLKDMM